jgi:thymidylate synthase
MKQYLDLLQAIKDNGTDKPGAREGMPGSRSLFGHQFRHDLSTGFPALTTKKLAWKTMVVELLWFLRGDTNIKYLVDNGCNIWNEDAYNYYLKVCKETGSTEPIDLNGDVGFIEHIKQGLLVPGSKGLQGVGYNYGDCGHQYGKVWRAWDGERSFMHTDFNQTGRYVSNNIDQISRVIKSLKTNPESRRHIVTAVDPAHDTDLALYWCHSMFQFNCRPIEYFDGDSISYGEEGKTYRWIKKPNNSTNDYSFEEVNDKTPQYYLDCQLYQRSADVVLGVPFNIASYSLLTHIIAKICNMIPGEFIHTFGDVHIYDNHKDAVEEQLSRTPEELPKLHMHDRIDWDFLGKTLAFNDLIPTDFQLKDYHPQPAISAKLSTGLQ